MKEIPVVLLGCGGVGRHLLKQIISSRPLHAKMGLHLRIVGVCDSKSLLVPLDAFKKQLNDSALTKVCQIKSVGSPLSAFLSSGEHQLLTGSNTQKIVLDLAEALGKSSGLVFVDCSASSDTIDMLTRVAGLGCCVVLANKKPLTSTMEHYDQLTLCQRHIRYESTVGAGLPIIASLNRIINSGDAVHRIIGTLSGTLGYVMSELEDGKPFSEIVRAAKSLGFTEPDPRDDLSGMDVARKALILARLLGRKIEMTSLKVESLYPDEMGPSNLSVDGFLSEGIESLDNGIAERVKKALSHGNVLRYVFVLEDSRCEVGIQELPKNSPLGRLRGSDNMLEVYSECYKEQPMVIQGAGAGNETTAAGVLADIIDLQDLFS